VETLHLSGPGAAIGRLAGLAAQLGLHHDLESGVLSLTLADGCSLVEQAPTVLAPLEARLVRAIKVDVEEVTAAHLLSLATAAPTVANLVARRKHHRVLEAMRSREGVAVGFQPVIDLPSGRSIGFEALLRVRVGTNDIAPGDVLAAAEDAGWLVEIDSIARATAAGVAATDGIGERLLFLNVLPASLPVPSDQLAPFADEVRALGLDPGRIVLEMPVGPAGTLRRQVDAVLEATRDAGFLVGLDNVRGERDLDAVNVRPDFVKLDRSLVRGLPSTGATRALGQVVKACGHESASLVAQGIESPEQLKAVRELGVQLAQGWQLGRPGAITS
jgi:EAL domain-containing protein (putative c-di-GMP-specific phosphodiesterase class I)